jgi:Cdc6-like AAA superfamily ATPase
MTIDDRLDKIWQKIFEMETEIYEEVSTIEKRLEVLELTQRQILTAISELEK